MFKEKVRVGFLVDSESLRCWNYDIIEEIQASDIAEVVLIVVNKYSRAKRNIFRKVIDNFDYLSFITYNKIDKKLFKANNRDFGIRSIDELKIKPEIIKVMPRMTSHSDYFEDEDVLKLMEYNLDVLVRFGFRILRGKILNIPKYGVWSYHHDDNSRVRGGPPGFWEVFLNIPTTGSILQILSNKLDGGKVIYRSYASTDKWSVVRNKNNYYSKSKLFIMRKLRELHATGNVEENNNTNNKLGYYSYPLYRKPKNALMIKLMMSKIVHYMFYRLSYLTCRDQWVLYYKIKKKINKPYEVMYQYKPIFPPKDRFYADPFVVYKDDKYYIFIEEFVYKNKRAHISVIEMDPKGNYSNPYPVLDTGYHMSYPYIFTYDGTYYMIPETRLKRSVELYKCTSFPDKWELYKILFDDVDATDTTIAKIGDKYWLFVTLGVQDTKVTDELFVFFSDTPLGPWRSHPKNPVVSDARRARPAGKIFFKGNNFYRPSQDCSVRYGYAININIIKKIDEESYEEELVEKILPHWTKKIMGTHTINYDHNLTIVDAVRKRNMLV